VRNFFLHSVAANDRRAERENIGDDVGAGISCRDKTSTGTRLQQQVRRFSIPLDGVWGRKSFIWGINAHLLAVADWVAWQPRICRVGRQPGGRLVELW